MAPEAAVVWSEPTEENPGCFSDIARQPVEDTRTNEGHTQGDRSVSGGLGEQVNVCQYIKRRVSRQNPSGVTVC